MDMCTNSTWFFVGSRDAWAIDYKFSVRIFCDFFRGGHHGLGLPDTRRAKRQYALQIAFGMKQCVEGAAVSFPSNCVVSSRVFIFWLA